MKTCTKCGETKPLEDFHRNRGRADGRSSQCGPCIRTRAAVYREDRRVELAAATAAYRAARPGYMADYRAKNPHRAWESAYRERSRRAGHVPRVQSFTLDDLIARWGEACAHCGGDFEELDHYPVPVAHGGVHSLENCRPSCTRCNATGTTVRRMEAS